MFCGRGETASDTVIRFFVEIDPLELERRRRRQIAYLARYGRQPVLQWDDVDVVDMVAFHDEVSTIVGEENQLSEEA